MNQIRMMGRTILGYNGFFSLDRLKRDTKIEASYCTNTLFKFCKEGFVKKASKKKKEYGPGDRRRYVIIYLVVGRNGLAARIAPKTRKGPVQDRIWFVIRNKFRTSGSFNLRDVVVLGGVNKATARWYLKMLHRADIIALSYRTSQGFEWRLTGKYSGPSRPYLEYEKLRQRTSKTAPFKAQKGYNLSQIYNRKTHPGRFPKAAC
jgi:hypothetical protein